MGLNILDRIQAKIELFRLEQRYTKRRHRRSTFVSNATYVDGEYVYNTPNTTGSSINTQNSAAPSRTQSTQSTQTTVESPSQSTGFEADDKARKRMNRWSSMPGFGHNSKPSAPEDWRMGRVSEDISR